MSTPIKPRKAIRRQHRSRHIYKNYSVTPNISIYLNQCHIFNKLWMIAVLNEDAIAQRVFHTEHMTNNIKRAV